MNDLFSNIKSFFTLVKLFINNYEGFRKQFIVLGIVILATIATLISIRFAILPSSNSSIDISISDTAARLKQSATNATKQYTFKLNLPSEFGKKATFLEDVTLKKGLSVAGLSSLNGGLT